MFETAGNSDGSSATEGAQDRAIRVHHLPVWVVLTFVLLLLVNRLAFQFFTSPLPDEAYYWLWGQRPGFSYYDHPPLQAWFQGLIQALFGTSLFALRLPAVLSSLVLVFTLLWWARRFDGSLRGIRSLGVVLVVFASPFIFVFTSITFNDHLLIALLSAASIFVFKVFEEMDQKSQVQVPALYGAAVLIGLAGLTKYNAAVFAVGVVVAVLWFPKLRALLRSKHLYLAGLVCLAFLTPVFWWNYSNGGASFQYNLNDRVGGGNSAGVIASRVLTLLLLVTLLLSPFLLGAIVRAMRASRNDADWVNIWRRMSTTILISGIILCIVLTIFTYVLPYWTVIAFVAILPLAAFSFRRRWQVVAHLVYGVLIISLFTFNYTVLPISSVFGKTDTESGIMYGWAKISQEAKRLEIEHKVDFVAASDYRSGSILAFWTDNPETEVIAKRVSQFTLWFDEDQRVGQDALILTSDWFPMAPVISNRFETIEEVSSVTVRRFGFEMARYSFYVGKNYLVRKID